jgi:tetratricopeptide (TPR) repeat protein
MSESARAALVSGQSIALIESSPLSPASWMALADKARSQNDPLSVKSLEIIIGGLKRIEELQERSGKSAAPFALSGLSQSMFVRLARAYNSPTLLKEVGLIYLRDLAMPDTALEHFERSLLLGGPEKELRPLTEAAAVAVQRQLAKQNGEAPKLSGLSSAHHSSPVATTIIRRTGKTLLSAAFKQTNPIPFVSPEEADGESSRPLPTATEECLAEAEIAIEKGALQRAEILLRKANEKPGDAQAMWQAWTNLGQAYYEGGAYPEVEAAFSEALKYQPNELAAHFNAALGFHLNQKFELALEEYARANELQEKHPKVLCNLGVLYFQMDAYGQAEEALQGAVEADPDYARAWDNLAASLGAQDKFDPAIAACGRAIALRPEYPEAHFKLGIIYFSRNELVKAIIEFQRAAVLPTLTAYCDVFSAMGYARLEQTEAAEAAAWSAQQADPKCDLLWMAWNDLGLAWFTEKNYQRAATAYGEATVLKPDEAGAWFNLGVSQHRAGDLKAARESYQHAVDLNGSLAESWHNIGIVCAEMGDFATAVAAFRRETNWAPNNVRAWHDLAVAYRKAGDEESARAAFARAEALADPKIAPAEKVS